MKKARVEIAPSDLLLVRRILAGDRSAGILDDAVANAECRQPGGEFTTYYVLTLDEADAGAIVEALSDDLLENGIDDLSEEINSHGLLVERLIDLFFRDGD